LGKVLHGTFPLSGAKPLIAAEGGVEELLPRDQWGRPIIMPPDHEPHAGCTPKACGKAYRRASTVAEAIDDHYGLDVWKQRLLAQGLAQRPDLVQSIHTANRQGLAEIVEAALDQGGANVASRNGSTMHALTDRLDRGEDMPPGLPSNIVAMLEAYEQRMKRFTYLDGERFVVQDQIECAGTYDRRLADENGTILIGDLKTGQNYKRIALKTAAQIAVYAAGKPYTLDGERDEHGADRNRGVFIWLPWCEKPEQAQCELKWVDLRSGRQAILEARRLEDFRKMKAEQIMLDIR
jgi:hypothetical protein